MKAIKAELIVRHQPDDDATADAKREAKDADHGKLPVPADDPQSDAEVIAKHK